MRQIDVYGDGTVLVAEFEDDEAQRKICIVATSQRVYLKDFIDHSRSFTVTAIFGRIEIDVQGDEMCILSILAPGQTSFKKLPDRMCIFAQGDYASFMVSETK